MPFLLSLRLTLLRSLFALAAWPLRWCLIGAAWLLLTTTGCHRTVPFDTKLAEEELLAAKAKDVGPARPPAPDSLNSRPLSSRDTLTTTRDTVNAPSTQTKQMKEDADKLAKDKAKSKAELKALAKKAGAAAKKLKGKTFLGKRFKKGYARTGGGKSAVIEKFGYLKTYEAPDPYAPAKYYYHKKKRKIFKTSVIDPAVSLILHGPYEKRQNGIVIETGYFYAGTKHLRWERYALKDNILLSKQHWEKGFPRDARITYYPNSTKKIKEVLPYVNGKLEGDYVRFLDNGQLEWSGQYEGGRQVGVWTQYWGFRNRKHYQWQFPEDEFAPLAEPFLLREYNRNGTLIFEKGKVDKRAQNEIEERRSNSPKRPAAKGKAPKADAVADDEDGESTGGEDEKPAEKPVAKPAARPAPRNSSSHTRPTPKAKAATPADSTKTAPVTKVAADSSAVTPGSPTPPAGNRPPTKEEARERARRAVKRK